MVEIIPKETPPIPKWLNILFYFSLVLLVFSIIGYFVLDSSLRNSQKNLADSRETLAGEETPERITLEKEILSYEKKVKDFFSLIDSRQESSRIFNFLQKTCHPKVWFTQFSLDLKDRGVTFSGKTQSFESLGQQLLIFKDENLVKAVNLEKISISKEGEINFDLFLSFNPQIFRPE